MKKCNMVDDISIKMMSTDFNYNPDYDDKTLLKLIESTSDINMKGRDGRTLLINSALYNRIEIAKWLLEKGALIDEKDAQGLSALHCAVMSNNLKIVEFLLKQGADINAKDNWGNTPLMRAGLNIDMIKLLVDFGADCTVKSNSGATLEKIYEAYPQILSLFKM